MSEQALVTRPNGAVEPRDFDRATIELIKQTVAIGTTDVELQLFLYTAKRTGLDPLARQIYCVKRKGKMTIQTGIDGYRLIAQRTGACAGNDDPTFTVDKNGQPLTASVTVWRLVGGQRCPFSATARWSEYAATDEQGFMWRKMPFLMLGKTAEALALRKAFPAELSGLYTDTEMDQAGAVDATTGEMIGRSRPRPQRPTMRSTAAPSPARQLFDEDDARESALEQSDVATVKGEPFADETPEPPTHFENWGQFWNTVQVNLAISKKDALNRLGVKDQMELVGPTLALYQTLAGSVQ